MEKISQSEGDINLPKQTWPEEAVELFTEAHDLTQGAENFRTLGHLQNLEEDRSFDEVGNKVNDQSNENFKKARDLEAQSEKISLEAHRLRQKSDLKKIQADKLYDLEIEKLRNERDRKEGPSRLAELKNERGYLKNQNQKEKKAIPAKVKTPEIQKPQEVVEQDVIEVGLSSPEELKQYISTVTDLIELEQNIDTREEAIKDIMAMKERAMLEKNLKRVSKFDDLLKEQKEALSIIEDRITEIGKKSSASKKGFWGTSFKKIFGKNDAA